MRKSTSPAGLMRPQLARAQQQRRGVGDLAIMHEPQLVEELGIGQVGQRQRGGDRA
jgi:hypothetical protein